jgi:nucleoside-diphosphate-sugar epimerase
MSHDVHVVFGAGQVGGLLAENLAAAGLKVRVARRSSEAPPGTALYRGDAADPAFCQEAAQGAAVVYHCMNPPYDTAVWAELVPKYMDNLIAAAGRAGARLVVLDNLYMLGRTGGLPMTEDTPMNPCSRKGEIRARAAAALFEAYHRGDVRAVAARASDYYGPGGALTHLGETFWRPALAGKAGRVVVNPDMLHTYHYIPDVASGLAALGRAEDDVLACAPAGTLRELVGRLAQVLRRPLRIATTPRVAVKALGLFVPLLREVGEMLYQWDEPFMVDDRRFRKRFDILPVPWEPAARATVEWAKRAYSRESRKAAKEAAKQAAREAAKEADKQAAEATPSEGDTP